MPNFGSPLLVELKAIWQGLVEAKVHSLTGCIVDTDSKLSVGICTDQRQWNGPFQNLVYNIKSLIRELNATIQFVYRS